MCAFYCIYPCTAERCDCDFICLSGHASCTLPIACVSVCTNKGIIVRFLLFLWGGGLSEGQVVITLLFDPLILTDLPKYTAELSRPGNSSSNQHPRWVQCACQSVCVRSFIISSYDYISLYKGLRGRVNEVHANQYVVGISNRFFCS